MRLMTDILSDGMSMPSALPGFPGQSHLYHIGATGFFLDHPEHITDKVVRATTVVSVSKWVLALGCLAYLSAGFTGVWSRALRR